MNGSKNVFAFNKPVFCSQCRGQMIYQGVGEYKCENCGALDYDDYGKVRNYIEQHPGARQNEVSEATGVSRGTIRQLLIEERIEVASNSAVFLHCAKCGKEIRSGMYCAECQLKAEKEEKAKAAKQHGRNITGGSANPENLSSGERRFMR